MVNQQLGNPLVRAAVRTVLAGGALAAAFGVANAQQAATSQPDTQQANTQTSTQAGDQQLLAQATVPAPAAGGEAASTSAALQLQEVVVTGSRIATPNQTAMSPIQFVGAKQFQQAGAVRVEDVLNKLPQVFADQNGTSINGGVGISTIDLRGLGASRTLVLVNGERLPNGDTGVPGADINMVPPALIENVQILTGGASAQYGSDAVAGVVNFKLMDHFQGVKLVANGGGYFHSNNNDQGVETAINTFNASGAGFFQPAPSSVATGATKALTFIAGINTPDNKGNATFYASYRNTAKAVQNEYSYSACSLASGFAPNDQFSCAGSHTAYPGTFQFLPLGATPSLKASNTVGPNGTLLPLSAEPEFNFGPLNYFQAPQETWNAGAFLHYTFNEHAQVYADTMFMSNDSRLQIAQGGDFNAPLAVNCTNPYMSQAQVNAWCDGSTTLPNGGAAFTNQTFTAPTTFANGVTYAPTVNPDTGAITNPSRTLLIGYRNVPGQDRVTEPKHQDWRMSVGVKGAITDNWTYDASYQYSQMTEQVVSSGDLSKTKMGYALDAVSVVNGSVVPKGTPGATIECSVTQQGITTGLASGCVPWNIFSPGQVTPAMENYLGVSGITLGEIKQHIIDTNFTGDLSQYLQLPTAHSGLQVALGTEYIDWDLTQTPDVTGLTADEGGTGGITNFVSGAIQSFSEYLEARLPILQDKPFAKSLTMDDTIRHSHYATGFSTNTYSLELAWQPIQDVRLRGTFTRAVRAPNITELFGPQTVGLDGTTDPCVGTTPKFSAAQCAREGVSAAQYGTLIANSAGQYNGLVGGNTSLKPETAITKTFGIQFTPSFLQNFSASVDYYDIKISGIIRGIGANTVVNDCGNQNLFCNDIHRDQFGSLWLTNNGFVTDTLQNVGILEEKGIDVQLNYAFDMGAWGRLDANLTGTHIQNYDITPIQDLPSSEFDCASYYGGTCSAPPTGAPLFSWRHNLQVTWLTPFRSLSVTLGWRYLSSATLDALNPNPNLSTAGATIANGGISGTDAHIPAFNYIDMSMAYQVFDAVQVRLGVNNLGDKSPPVIGASDAPTTPFYNGNTLPGTYDWGGRFVFGEIDVQF
jgi:outer membrane receptor protein involved in Fe transport